MYRNPDTASLLEATAAFLRETCAPALHGREAFLARVAANAVEIAARELHEGPEALAQEKRLLSALVAGQYGDIAALRGALCAALRSGAMDASTPGLVATLETIIADRVRIEQPNYASLRRVEPAASSLDSAP